MLFSQLVICEAVYRAHLMNNRSFPNSLVSVFQSESNSETILMKMTLIFMKIKLLAELIFI